MGYAANQLLAPLSILKTISRINLPGTSLSQLMGWNVGNGPIPGALFQEGNEGEGGNLTPRGNFMDHDLRSGQYDIFDYTRKVASATTPGASTTLIEPQAVGAVQFTIPRTAERMILLDEKIHNQRQLGAGPTQIDRGGEKYISAQERYMAARIANMIEFQTAAMLRGSYSFTVLGNRLVHAFSGGSVTINYQRPAGNLTKLDMLGAGDILAASWENAGTDIPLHLFKINEAMTRLTGNPLKHVVITSTGWNHVVNNTKVHTQGGSSQIVFDTIRHDNAGEFTAVLRSIPWVTWHIVDYSLQLETAEGTFTETKLIEDDHAVFLPEINDTWATYIRGGEWVTEGPNGVKEFRNGFYPYSCPANDPSGWNLACIHNGFPANPVPKAIAYGLIVY